jgi:hypothetical protein
VSERDLDRPLLGQARELLAALCERRGREDEEEGGYESRQKGLLSRDRNLR